MFSDTLYCSSMPYEKQFLSLFFSDSLFLFLCIFFLISYTNSQCCEDTFACVSSWSRRMNHQDLIAQMSLQKMLRTSGACNLPFLHKGNLQVMDVVCNPCVENVSCVSFVIIVHTCSRQMDTHLVVLFFSFCLGHDILMICYYFVFASLFFLLGLPCHLTQFLGLQPQNYSIEVLPNRA